MRFHRSTVKWVVDLIEAGSLKHFVSITPMGLGVRVETPTPKMFKLLTAHIAPFRSSKKASGKDVADLDCTGAQVAYEQRLGIAKILAEREEKRQEGER